MTLIQYYLFANIYLLAFWICYRIGLKNLVYFKSIRIYLNAALILSTLLPFIQFNLANVLGSSASIAMAPDLPLAGIVYTYQWAEALPVETGPSYSPAQLIQAILLSGSMFTAVIYVILHLRIYSIIRKSANYLWLGNGLRAFRSDHVNIPFVYFNRIVIPGTVAEADLSRVMEHEAWHHRNIHHLDNLLFALFHTVFWMNPFFLLMRRALKLNHEYQVDRQMISNGLDPVSYKLSLIKYTVGRSLFALANGLSSTSIRHRIMMINHLHIRKGKWKLYMMLPAITLLFAVFTFSCMEPSQRETQTNALADASADTLSVSPEDDTLYVEIINPWAGPESKDAHVIKNTHIVVLMNRSSQIMIEEEVLDLEDVEQKIIAEYNRRLEENKDLNADDYPENTNLETRISLHCDRATDKMDYQKLVDAISTALFKLRDMHAVRLYGGLYASLSETDKMSIDSLIPLRIYGAPPKNMTGMDTPPLFRGKEKEEFIAYVVQNLHYPEALAESKIKGHMLVQVVIESDGSVGDVEVIESVHPDVDKEVIRVIKSSPRWIPATKKWKDVPATVELRMSFALN